MRMSMRIIFQPHPRMRIWTRILKQCGLSADADADANTRYISNVCSRNSGQRTTRWKYMVDDMGRFILSRDDVTRSFQRNHEICTIWHSINAIYVHDCKLTNLLWYLKSGMYDITIDKQLFPRKARCPFTQYISNEPDKLGIKFWFTADSKSKFVLNRFPPYIKVKMTPVQQINHALSCCCSIYRTLYKKWKKCNNWQFFHFCKAFRKTAGTKH